MPDDPRPEGQQESAPAQQEEQEAAEFKATATATAEAEEEEGQEKPPEPLNQQVLITDAGTCLKHIKVSIPREDINKRINAKFNELMPDAVIPGYRPGKAPRKLLEKRFLKDVREQLKAELLLQSLEQLAEDHHLNPIAQPNVDPFKIELPADGPFEYEFDIEVAPEFELPQYKELKIKRPVKETTDADVQKALDKLLRNYGKLVVKDGPAEMGDYLVTDVDFVADGQPLNTFKGMTVRVDAQLAFKDGLVNDFGEKIKGAMAGDTRQMDFVLSASLSDPVLRGRTVSGSFNIKEIKALQLPELTHEFLHTIGSHSEDELRGKVRTALERQLEYEQRRVAREQVSQQLAHASQWDLPEELVTRQARKTLQRRVMELQQAGFSEEEIRGRANLLRQDAQASTVRALKEHFVLQKIADVEKIEVKEEDVDQEIENIAEQTEESPRRVRARLEKEDLTEALMNQILERKALDLVLSSAVYEDVPLEAEKPVASVEEDAVPGGEPEPETSIPEAQPETTE